MRIDEVIAGIYMQIFKETGISTRVTNKCMRAYYKEIRSIMRDTAEGKINMINLGKLVFNTAKAEQVAKRNDLLSRGVKNKIDQKSKKPMSIYELTGIKRRNETT